MVVVGFVWAGDRQDDGVDEEVPVPVLKSVNLPRLDWVTKPVMVLERSGAGTRVSGRRKSLTLRCCFFTWAWMRMMYEHTFDEALDLSSQYLFCTY